MQRPVAILLVVVLFAFLMTDALAHGGGLDRHGSHQETATGGYHCHRGGGDGGDNGGSSDVDWGVVAGVLGGLIALALVLRWLQPDSPTHELQLSLDAEGTAEIGYPIGNSQQIGIRSTPSTEGDSAVLTYWRLRY